MMNGFSQFQQQNWPAVDGVNGLDEDAEMNGNGNHAVPMDGEEEAESALQLEENYPEDIQYFLDAHRIFTEMHHKLEPILHDPGAVRREVRAAAAAARAALGRCAEGLAARCDAAAAGDDAAAAGAAAEAAEVRGLLLALWHLAEAFLLDPRPRPAAGALAWLQEHYTKYDAEGAAAAAARLAAHPRPETAAAAGPGAGEGGGGEGGGFWGLVCGLAAQGRPDLALEALQLHSACGPGGAWRPGAEGAEAAAVLLAQLPLPTDPDATGEQWTEFEARWRRWSAQARGLEAELAAGGGAAAEEDPGLLRLLGVLAGRGGAGANWAQRLVSELVYVSPTIRRYELRQRMEALIAEEPMNELFDRVVLAVVGGNAGTAVQCCHGLGNGLAPLATTAHLCDLLLIAGALEPGALPGGEEEGGVDLREQLFLEVAAAAEGAGLGWGPAAAYLERCPVRGRAAGWRLAERAAAAPETTDAEARALVALCRRLGEGGGGEGGGGDDDYGGGGEEGARVAALGTGAARRAASAFARGRLARGFPAAAAYWFHQAGDQDRLAALCQRLLERCRRALAPSSAGGGGGGGLLLLEEGGGGEEAREALAALGDVAEAVPAGSPGAPPELAFLEGYRAFALGLAAALRGTRAAAAAAAEGGGAATGQEAAAAAATAALARLAGLAGLPRAATGVPECFWVHLLQLARPLLEMVQTNAAVTLSSRHLNQLLLKIHEIETMPLKHYAFAGAQDLKELDDNSSEPLTSLVSSAIVKAIYVEHANARPDEQLIRFQMENHGFENAIDYPDSPEESSLHYLPSSADDLLAMAIPLL